jgi:predicted transcriptional regulator
MTWIIALSALALYIVLILYIMCLFIVSSMADARKEAIINHLLAIRRDHDVASASMSLIPERMRWTPVQPQEANLINCYS